MIQCLRDYPTVEESSAFIFYSHIKGLKNSTVGNTVLHVVSSNQGNIESHGRARPWDNRLLRVGSMNIDKERDGIASWS